MWPAIDEKRRRQLIGEMAKCLVRLDAVLDPAAGSDEAKRSIWCQALRFANLLSPALAAQDISAAARSMTVLVSCWK